MTLWLPSPVVILAVLLMVLPYITAAGHCTNLPVPLKLTVLARIEYSFNIYPATAKFSAILQVR